MPRNLCATNPAIFTLLLLALLTPTFAEKPALPPDLRTRKTGQDWPTFNGPTANLHSTEKGILTDFSKLKVRYTIETGEGYANITTSRGRLFLFDQVKTTARLRCLNAETGKQIWQFTYPSDYQDLLGYARGARAYPIVDRNRVYISGPEGMIHCLKVTSGKLIWKTDLIKPFNIVKNFFGVGSTPIIHKNLLIVMVGGSPPNNFTDVYNAQGKVPHNNTAIVAFNKLTGKVVYKTGPDLASYASLTIKTINKKPYLFAFARAGLLAVNPDNGKQHFYYPWRSKLLESVNAATPIIIKDHVFISECYSVGSSLLKVTRNGYDVVWSDINKRTRLKSLLAHWMTPIHINGYIYASSGRNSGGADIRCIELKTGKVQWTKRLDQRCTLLYIDNHLLVLSEYGQIFLIKPDPKKFTLVTSSTPPSPDQPRLIKYPAWAAPVVSHGILYIRSNKRLTAFNLIPKK